MTSLPTARRGRPRQFDRDQALRTAMHVFWERGFEATSLGDLTCALGLTATSIYAAFGSKELLFKAAVELYVADDGNATWRALMRPGHCRDALRAMLYDTVTVMCNTSTPRGCLVVMGDRGISSSGEAIKVYLQQWRAKARDQLRMRFARAINEGELAPATDAAAVAGMVMVFLNGISVESADGVPEQELLAAVEVFLSTWRWDG